MSDWIKFTEIDFSDTTIQQYHVDTRDFCVATNPEKSTKELDFYKPLKQAKDFVHTPEEVVALLTRLYNESGGKANWRFLSLDEEAKSHTKNWQIKYIRIHRVDGGLMVCNSSNYALKKSLWACPVNQEYLHAG